MNNRNSLAALEQELRAKPIAAGDLYTAEAEAVTPIKPPASALDAVKPPSAPWPGAVIERLPDELPAIMRDAHECAARSIEDLAAYLKAVVDDAVLTAGEAATKIRALGQAEAARLEATASMVRDINRIIRDQTDKVAACGPTPDRGQ